MKADNYGFTLIELLVSFFIAILIILAITFSFKTIISGWNKTEKFYIALQKYVYIEGILKKSLKKIKTGRNLFFKGKSDILVYFTENNGMHVPGLTELGFFCEKNTIKICYIIIKSQEDIVEPYVLKNTGKCYEFDNVNVFFSYGNFKDENLEFNDEALRKPAILKVNIKTGKIDEEIIFRI